MAQMNLSIEKKIMDLENRFVVSKAEGEKRTKRRPLHFEKEGWEGNNLWRKVGSKGWYLSYSHGLQALLFFLK